MTAKSGKQALIVMAVLATVYLGLWRLAWAVEGPGAWELYQHYRRIRPGMSGSEVVALLGKPDDRGTKFRLAQDDGYEKERALAQTSGSRQWLFWERGELVFAVGLNQHGRVTMKAYGGT